MIQPDYKAAFTALDILRTSIDHALGTMFNVGLNPAMESDRDIIDELDVLHHRVEHLKANVLLMAHYQGDIEFTRPQ